MASLATLNIVQNFSEATLNLEKILLYQEIQMFSFFLEKKFDSTLSWRAGKKLLLERVHHKKRGAFSLRQLQYGKIKISFKLSTQSSI